MRVIIVVSVIGAGLLLGGCALLRDGLGKTDFFERLERQGQ